VAADRGVPVQALVAAAAVVVILAALHGASELVVPVVVAGLVTVIAAPYQQRLVRRGVHRLVAFGLVLAATVVALVVIVVVLEAAITAFIADLPSYEPGIEQLLAAVLHAGAGIGLDLTHLVNVTNAVRNAFSTADVLTHSLLTSLAEWTIVLLLAVFMLFEALDFPQKLEKVLGGPERMGRAAAFVSDLSGFMRLTTVDASVTAVGDFVILVVLGAPSALLWAGLAFLFSYVPDVGFVMTVVPPTVATFVRYGAARGLLVLVVLTVIDTLVGVVLLPRLVGKRLGIAPFWAILSLVFWTWLLGPAGAILAVPLTITVKFLLESSPVTSPLATLIAPLAEGP
jgi:AI-2 transport protein TqsA